MRAVSWVALCALVLCGVVSGEDHAFDVVDKDEIYHGAGKHPKAPAAITADDVWEKIPEYAKIVAEELEEDDPRYHLLMKKATERFSKALKKLADREDYDMIAEVGAVKSNSKPKEAIPDETEELIKLVTRD